MKDQKKFTSIGGQAVIEGVMMRSPHFMAIAVRKPGGRIVIRTQPYEGFVQRHRWMGKPIIRGVVTLFESMFQGIDALSYSANVALEPESPGEKKEELSGFALAGSIASAFVLGIGLFVALPHFLTAVFAGSGSVALSAESPLFHLVDGAFKVAILLAYVYGISFMKDIKRVFQYHGAEHKAIYTFEAGEELTISNARRHTTLHPRCGTSFLLFLVLISILVFSFAFPLLSVTSLSSNAVLNHILMVLIKIVLMLPIAGLAYEFIKASACRMQNPLFKVMIWPGLMLQKLTTREPDDSQLEVALSSLVQCIRLEKGAPLPEKEEHEIGQLADLGHVQAQVVEFLET